MPSINPVSNFRQINFGASLGISAGYGGDPGTYGAASSPFAQQNFLMGIYMQMMQSQQQLASGFSQFMGQGQGGYGAPQGYGQPSYGGPSNYKPVSPGYGGPTNYKPPVFKPAPAPRPAPAPAPKAPAKKGGYA